MAVGEETRQEKAVPTFKGRCVFVEDVLIAEGAVHIRKKTGAIYNIIWMFYDSGADDYPCYITLALSFYPSWPEQKPLFASPPSP